MDVAVVVMTFQAGPVVEAYVRKSGLPWPILIDESREVYSAYGMNRGSRWNVYGPATMWKSHFRVPARRPKSRARPLRSSISTKVK